MNIIALTDIGLVRAKNQDSFFSSNEYDFPLFIMADGMGGHNGGEIASSDAINIIKEIFLNNKEKLTNKKNIRNTIYNAIEKANSVIYKKSLELPEYNGMGTTISLCYIFKNHIFIGHVGDSRIYKIGNDSIIQLTEDHSLVNELIKKNEITKEEAKNHPQKNMITRAVGTSFDIEIDIIESNYKKEDKLLLCTDGLFNMVYEDQIFEIIKDNISIIDAGEKLIERAKKNGGLDNISLIIIEF
ncbi:Stp1/IreP family PP2C-type Ser/Thr phosphatase [Tissierella creatinophila]|uniref:Serine/threonine phosphatase stp n=1 Tax=Tissierella creatinophila DSM 6911 TaxID=1123403 RepID=A0A1U7M322_TISCR|nr:Stp1/IreP family PP2C-type Ser/Thr phosphatase [Tissierella creatinophila]OLS01712.1 serine/threonine phosphatase stp [Tissierella creatinophila DSM 6911]